MATASSNGFQLVVPETAKRAEADSSGFTVPCHLSPEISAVDMEIRWFKETDCVCLYKNRHMIEGRSYKGNARQFTDVLEKGDVSLSLTRFRESDVGDYVCQVTSGDRTEEITVQVKRHSTKSSWDRVQEMLEMQEGIFRIHIDDINRTWTEEERLEMEESALMAELKNPGDLKNFITEKDTKITHLEEHKERSLLEKDQFIQEKDTILLENKQTLEMKDKELEKSKHQLETLRNEVHEVKLQLDEQKNKFTNQEKLLEEHKQQQQQYDETIKRLHSEVERLKEVSSTHLAELNEKCKCLEDTEKPLTVRDIQINDLEKSKETALEEKDRLLYNAIDKLKQTTTEAEEKQREIEEKNKLMSEKETLLENAVKELETSKHQLETLRNELKEMKLELDETGYKNSLLQVQLEEKQQLKSSEMVLTTPVRRSKSMEWNPPKISGETAPVMVSGSELRLVLLGSAESEKSVAGNIILRREKNQTDTSAETQQSEIKQEEVDGKQVTVVETSDWFCSGLSLEEVRQDVRRCIRLSAPGPHAFLLVIPVHQSTGVVREMKEKIEEIFGQRWWENTLILFTVTENEQEKNIEDFVQSGNQEIQRLVEKCGNRFHCLNIHQSEDGSQVSELLEKIEKMMEGNTERSYRSEIYLEVESQIRAMEKKHHKRQRGEQGERE
ncbi:unconventional myosin-XVIIIa-like isoform X2 [Triplophysa dalaica]|uniref:unconventional myosin-XVIIIa-like isoform X2 n=1 Tax=Triplophysa dalaica TaxID=1582913 RepID=UPI0024DF610F|nr:unconventional myosin-XVIIIa-like isoform X2 [Triplophysa dalaica]